MRILWLVSIIFPYPAGKIGVKKSVFGGWLNGLFNSLSKNKNITLAIATVYDGKEFLKFVSDGVTYYLVPYKNKNLYDKKSIQYWKKINSDFKPDLAHIHGCEYPFGLVYKNMCNVKTLLSIQGLKFASQKYYSANIKSSDILRNITFRDLVKLDTIFWSKRKWKKTGKLEIELIKKVDYITGRTTWDYANTYETILKDKYFHCNENLRDIFYEKEWQSDKIQKHTIFVSQASYPLKGFHILVKALKYLKIKYPNITVYVTGQDILKNDTLYQKLKLTGYAKYLIKLIKKYNLEQNIIFLGQLNEDEVCNKMLKSNVYIQTSSVENSSNSLGEAMILGMPIIASYVGGTGDMISDKKEGLLYPFGEFMMIYKYVCDIFDNNKLANTLGNNVRKRALTTHDRCTNTNNMIEIYKKVINK